MARARRFTRSAPRTKMWIGFGVGSTTLAGSSVQLVASYSAAALLLRPFTILRTRALFTFESDQTAVSERPIASIGAVIVTAAAQGVGVTALPDPSGISGDADADWFIWQAMMASLDFQSAVGFEGHNEIQYVIDSKAMRKVGPDDDLVLVSAQETASGAVLTTNGRQLIQLH